MCLNAIGLCDEHTVKNDRPGNTPPGMCGDYPVKNSGVENSTLGEGGVGKMDSEVPSFVRQLFGRNGPETFFHNHINCIEDVPVLCLQPVRIFTYLLRCLMF